MAYDVSTLGTYSTADQLKAVDHAIMTILLGGQERTISGRARRDADLTALQKLKAELQTQLIDESGEAPGGNVLVRWGEAV